jgi:hypothetical protein
MSGNRKYVTLAGKGGNDFYFLHLRGSYQKIRENPAAGEVNTLVIVDKINPDESPPAVMQSGSGLLMFLDRDGTSGEIIIKNWFGKDTAPTAPISCFVFLPDFKVYGPDDVANWLHRYDMLIASRKAGQARAARAPGGTAHPQARAKQELRRIFTSLPVNTAAEHIGVYESNAPLQWPPGLEGNRYGSVTVNVRKNDAPVLLILTAYEPVHWIINKSDSTQIAGVILSGYYRQSVESNAPGIPVHNLSRGMSGIPYFYAYEDVKMTAQAQTISILTGLPAAAMRRQGAYKASAFDIE